MATAFKQQTRQLMKAVYQWQRQNQTRSVIRRSGKTRFIKDTDWERGVFWSCVAAAWKATEDKDYLDGVLNYTLHTGFRTGPNARFADDLVCSQGYLDVYPLINQAEALEPTINFINDMVDNPKAGREDWWWCDSLFMAPPAFVALAKQTGEKKYLDYMDQAWWDSVSHLQDPETGLFYRDHRYIPDGKGGELREQNGEKVFWSRGIGWVIAAIPRLLQHTDDTFSQRDRYLALYKQLAEQVIKYQHQDGFWRASLLDPTSFPAPESSATALFCYALAWGVNHEILDKQIYLPVVELAWKALQSAVHSDGMIGWVQLPAFNPRDVKFEHNIDYGAGAFLLAGSEVQHLYD
ncbi:rhamnogalacturonyl hydrolase YesR [Volucribacter psittacicida]|uniref:Rhamnogalacturonyl hydrolase YesR n=1 Tax=Volucribacter psittacicida TaxID=203482 RepID=A0A4R1FM25_9PAST|nr:glycoside hydrolase family 88 protein [Volucribacter psittacicida]TCJ95867.1 rhamnogalacturonyl hydrolase YesR [Volucribacter psittacicida]